MKIIDLLQRIANGEEVPKKIKYDNQVFEYRKDMLDYYCYDYDLNLMGYQKNLNDEVEIIEEDKKIEKLEYEEMGDMVGIPTNQELMEKINEIIDYINKGDE